MKQKLLFLLLFYSNLSFSNFSVLSETRSIKVNDLENYSFSENIVLIKKGDKTDFFQIGLRENETLENLSVFQLIDGKKKKYNLKNLLSESTIDNSSFFSGRKINFFPIIDTGSYEINYTIISKETIFISEFYKFGLYNAAFSFIHIELPEKLQLSTSYGTILKGSIQLNQNDFLDSIVSMKVLVHPTGSIAEDYFSDWFDNKIKHLSSLNESDIPKELLDLRYAPKETLAKAIFDFVKGKIIYVDIENGINAIVPRDCSFVQKKGRGDCKDMANLLFAYYKFFQFDAYLAISKTNSREEKFDFPSLAEANHMICILFIDGAPIFLDATEKECDFYDPSLQIFNSEVFIIGKKPYFLDVPSKPFFRSETNIILNFEINDKEEWIAKLSISTLGKSNTILKSLMNDKKFVNNLPKIGNMLISYNWKLIDNSANDSSSFMDFYAPISKSDITIFGNSIFVDFTKKLNLNMISNLFFGDTIPLFAGTLNLQIVFPGTIKSSFTPMVNDCFEFAKVKDSSNIINLIIKEKTESLKSEEWLKLKENINSILNKPIEINYEKT